MSIALFGEQARWGDLEHLMAGAFDLLAAGNWQRGGGKGQRPQPVKRPGAGPKVYGKAIPFAEAKERLERRRRGIPA